MSDSKDLTRENLDSSNGNSDVRNFYVLVARCSGVLMLLD